MLDIRYHEVSRAIYQQKGFSFPFIYRDQGFSHCAGIIFGKIGANEYNFSKKHCSSIITKSAHFLKPITAHSCFFSAFATRN